MNQKEAIEYVDTHDHADNAAGGMITKVFRVLYGRNPEDGDLDHGLWALCCNEASLLRDEELDEVGTIRGVAFDQNSYQ